MKVVIVNDTSVAKHFGCEVVMDTYKRIIKERGHQLIGTVPVKKDALSGVSRFLVDKADVVIVNAEGSLHHARHLNLLRVVDIHPNVCVVNGSYQALSHRQIAQLRKARLVTCRESKSWEYLSRKEIGVIAHLIPDIFLAHDIPVPHHPGTATGTWAVFDSIVGAHPQGIKIASKQAYLKKAARYKRWITGRFHGICLAVLWDIPILVYGSNTWKNEGMMADLGLSMQYEADWEGHGDDLPPETADYSDYRNRARNAINQMFNEVFSGKA